MNRPAVLVLLLTFIALVVATLRVPVTATYHAVTGPGLAVTTVDVFRWVSEIGPTDEIRWMPYTTQLALVLAVGGLLALALHLRARRGASDPA